MKRIRRAIAKIVPLCLIVGAVWFVGNYMCLLPEQDSVAAASFVANRYMQPDEGETFLAVASARNRIYPLGELQTFEIHDGELTVARVRLNDFLGLGWHSRRLPDSCRC